MKRSRYFGTELLISVPLIIIGALLILADIFVLPSIVRLESARVISHYRELAEAVMDNEIDGVFDCDDLRGSAEMSQRFHRGSWGYQAAEAERMLVWYQASKKTSARGVFVPVEREVPYRLYFRIAAFLLFMLAAAFTDYALRRFHRFMKERVDFMSATAHDLVTPLAGLKRVIGKNDKLALLLTDRLDRLVQNVRAFLRLDGRAAKPQLAEVDLAALYQEAYELFRADYRAVADGKDIAFSGSAPKVLADPVLTLQIIWNLLTNALKYAAPYGPVEVRLMDEGDRVRMDFIDFGPGIGPSALKHVFERYYREKGVMETGKGGFGIGLCTAREAARAMGGDLTVAPNSPHGTIFSFTIFPHKSADF